GGPRVGHRGSRAVDVAPSSLAPASSALTTVQSSAAWKETIRRLASMYAARLPCWSTWSAQTFVMHATLGLAEQTARWFEVSSAMHQAGGLAASTRSSRPDVGQALSAGASLELSVSMPLSRSIASASRVVVVLPALPVTPSTGTGAWRSNRSAAPDAPAR